MSPAFDGSIESLQEQSKNLARSQEARVQWLADHEDASEILRGLDAVWSKAIEKRETTGGLNEDGKVVECNILRADDEQLQRAILCARIIRNVVVNGTGAQARFFTVIAQVMEKLWKCTSFTYVNDNQMHMLTRTFVQIISNLVTGNESLQEIFWANHLAFHQKQNDLNPRSGADLLARLSQSKDVGTCIAAQILLFNCTLESETRCSSLASTHSGKIVIEGVLKAIRDHVDKEEEEGCDSAESPGKEGSDEFTNLCFSYFSNLFDRQLFGRLYANVCSTETFNDTAAIITPSQLTLLKLLDSYLHLEGKSYGKNAKSLTETSGDLSDLPREMTRLSVWAESVMKASLKEGTSVDVDARLVDVHVGLILQLQILISICLKTEDAGMSNLPIGCLAKKVLSQIRQTPFLQTLVSLLHTLGQFSPAVSPFRPIDPSKNSNPYKPPPEGHVFSSTGLAGFAKGEKAGPSLDNLKRDIVNLLGVLAFERGPSDKGEVRKVQDTIRECGGLVDVLSMTQLDERNPYIRERAIFTLRALLQGNQASQDFIAQIKPISQ